MPPKIGEMYFLRLLLYTVKSATSWEDLCSYHGITYTINDTSDPPDPIKRRPNFRTACHTRGLCDDDKDVDETLKEASIMQSGSMLRHLFASILVQCVPSDPVKLWKNHADRYVVDSPSADIVDPLSLDDIDVPTVSLWIAAISFVEIIPPSSVRMQSLPYKSERSVWMKIAS